MQIPISTEQITTTLNYSDLIEDVKPIKLETKDSANVLLEIDKVIIDDDKIFILDKFRFQGVMAFDTSGRFLFSKKVGGGAEGEFTHLSGMSVDKKRKQLIIFSTPKLLYYSYEGKFLGDKKLDFLANDFETNGEINTFIGQEYGLIVTDYEGKILSKYFDKNKIHLLKLLQPFQVQEKGILFRHSFNDTVYIVNQEKLEKYAIIDFQDKKLIQKEIENM
ncbi:MAG: 6-bladed beta-propeller, partial [Raineya sp.]